MNADNTTQPRWQRRKEARPAEIIHAALQLFIQKGFAATRLDEVAKQAGVTKGTLYLYFPSKEELFKAAVRETVVPSILLAEKIVADAQLSPEQLLRCLVGEWIRLIAESPANGISKLVVAEAGNFPDLAHFYLDEVVYRVRKVLAEILQRGIDSGEFRPLNIEFAVKEIISPVILQTIWNHAFGPYRRERLDMAAFTEFHLDVLLRGIRA
ncbi:MAG: TetR/AcrR family transcriptional regulator [Neisseriaceae bacterium]|jgi:AcrR family transcriptional regulator|nr:MAG: TetR/AcrR family transcriptional regulator [Neisseriaceae bacterium]